MGGGVRTLISDNNVSQKIEIINIKKKYNLDNTGIADCSTLINQAISEADNGSTLYLPSGTYLLNSTVNVNKSINLKFEGKMKYSGTEFAFFFTNYNHCNAEFNEINASNGSCIKLFSDWTNNKHFIQYSHFSFQKLKAKAKTDTDSDSYCIFAESVNDGWINENRFTGGKIESGSYGVYADCYGENAFNGNLFDSCGIEGVGVGFYLANGCCNNLIFRCRHSESFEKFLNTVGSCIGLKVISTSPFMIKDNIISDDTTGFVFASLMTSDYTFCGSKATFARGTIICENSDNTKYLSTEPAGIFDMTNLLDYNEQYNNFVVSGLCSGIKLNKKYGYTDGINEFFVKFINANTVAFPIIDCNENELIYTIPQVANSIVRFNWCANSGWQFNYEFSNPEQVKELIQLSTYVKDGEVVKTINNISPDENGNVEIVVIEEEPIVVSNLAECVDTTKKYVLPDGYIYAYRKRFYPGEIIPNFTNQLPISQSPTMDGSIYNNIGYKYQKCLIPDYSNQVFTENDNPNSDFGIYTTGLIPVKLGDVVRVNRIGCHAYQGMDNALFKFVRSSLQYYATFYKQNDKMDSLLDLGVSFTVENSGNNYIYSDVVFPVNSDTIGWIANASIGWVVCCFQDTTLPDDIIITVNEEITYTVTEDRYEWNWENTGELYVKPDYLSMISALEKRVADLEAAQE